MNHPHETTNNGESVNYWRKLAQDLDLDIAVDAVVPGLEGMGVAAALVKGFGAKLGMIVVQDYMQVDPWVDDLIDLGYGYSSFSADDGYNRSDAIEMLSDWGWTGDTVPPPWLR